MKENRKNIEFQNQTRRNVQKNLSFFQPKLSINTPGDVHEQEADAMADKVMRMKIPQKTDTFFKPAISTVQRKCAACAEEDKKVHRKENSGSEVNGSNELDNYVSSLSSSGQPLSESSRQFFEPRFGQDFSNVKVHTDSVAAKSAQSINALAYTTGNNIVFNQGQYSPDSESGQRLMAHELTHVVQQGKQVQPKLIQRLECDLGHLDRECGGAAAKCHTADAYCASHYANPAAINTLYNNAVAGAHDRATSFPQASVNLLHFLDNTGTSLTMPTSLFETDSATTGALMVHRDRFIAGAITRINDGRLTPGGTADMIYTNTANAFHIVNRTDLGLAVGGYTLCSKVTVQAIAQAGGTFQLKFLSWTVQAFDCYNWDPGKGIGLPGASDNDLCCLENSGRAKHFRVDTTVWNNTNAASMADATITATPPSTGTPAAPTSVPSGNSSSQGGGIGNWFRSLLR